MVESGVCFINNRILIIRLDVHLAEFYGVEIRVLKQTVRMNKKCFAADFRYELTDVEIGDVVSQNVILSRRHFGDAVPFAFTLM